MTRLHKRTSASLAGDRLGNRRAWLRILNGDACSVVQISRTNNKSLGERTAAAASRAIFGKALGRAQPYKKLVDVPSSTARYPFLQALS